MRISLLILLSFLSISVTAASLNPLSYGLRSAKDGKERFSALMSCHNDAVKMGCDISYEGIDTIELEIPTNSGSIPLPKCTDFAGTTIIVQNDYKPFYLFSFYAPSEELCVDKDEIDKDTYRSPTLHNGKAMLLIEDGEPWVDNRRGFSYGATRRDVILVDSGTALNQPVYKYNTQSSSPKVKAIYNPQSISVKNLNFYRTSASTKIAFPLIITGTDGVEVSNVSIHTPQDNTLYGDAAIRIVHSANITLRDINIDGTYSHRNGYGYGINFENVYNVHIDRMYARARWGVFGTNNTNKILLTDCDINRFDIHCYGRDVKAVRCKFSDFYNQFSSVFGKVEFYKCVFTEFIPVLLEPSYNAYTPFDVIFRGCTFNMTKKKNFILTLSGLEEKHNLRPELARKAIPNITITDCIVNLPQGVTQWYVIDTGTVTYKESLDYMSKIKIDNLLVNSYNYSNFDFFNMPILCTETLRLSADRMYAKIRGQVKRKYSMQTSKQANNALVVVNGKRIRNN